jgi:hypothetical protein
MRSDVFRGSGHGPPPLRACDPKASPSAVAPPSDADSVHRLTGASDLRTLTKAFRASIIRDHMWIT